MDKIKAAEELALQFHQTYERLAPSFGYETRPDTKVFDPESNNGKLMIAVCSEILSSLSTHPLKKALEVLSLDKLKQQVLNDDNSFKERIEETINKGEQLKTKDA